MNLAFCREIFGPLLPVVPVEDLDEAIKFVNERLDFSYIHTYLLLSDTFHSETILWRFISSPKILKSRPKVTVFSSQLFPDSVF